jgi:chemotaxis signal transduction protein/ABC-type nitrate/sulfonate/bicarbonate transport system substrate-binding protein
MKILLVEDSKITRKMELKALNEIGFHNIVEADDGDEAIAKLQAEGDIHLILSDWNMPNKDGFELLNWVRSSEGFSGIPFIMATARGEKKQTAKASDAGVSNFITKPFSAAELDAVIENTFKAGKGSSEQPSSKKRIPYITETGKLQLNVAHIQITDHLTLGVLKHLTSMGKLESKTFDLQTHCMPGWNPVQQALENGEVDAAFVLAPIAMDIFGYGTPIKLALLAHRSGSICVQKRRPASTGSLQDFFRGKTFYIPHAMSIHHMLAHMFMREIGLKPGVAGEGEVDVKFEVVPPVKMVEFLGNNPNACGFLVAEPLGTKAISEGVANPLFLSGELWQNHPCCVLAVREEIIEQHPGAVQEFTNMLVEAGDFTYKRPEKAAEIGVDFLDPHKTLGLTVPILKNVLKESNGIRTNDLFPIAQDFERMQRYMVNEMGIGNMIDVDKFVDTRFAEIACRGATPRRRRSTMSDLSKTASKILIRQEEKSSASSKTMLGKEGKYLFFTLNGQEYGIGISSVREVIRIMPVRSVPQAPPFVKGVINLRGKVIPLLDLRAKFGYTDCEYNERSCIIVLEIHSPSGESSLVGIVVDAVSEVMNLKAGDIEESTFFGGAGTDYILAMAKLVSGVKILLNAARLFDESETRIVSAMASN